MTNSLILTTYNADLRIAEVVEYNHATGYATVQLIPGGIPVRVRMSGLAIGKVA